MQIVFLYFFFGIPAFYEAEQKYTAQPSHVLIEQCTFPKNPKLYTAENPFQIGDTVFITAPNGIYFGRVVNMQE
jgi:hypothetical protein